MTTFSDGGDGLHISNMAGLSSYSSSSGDMRFHLQILLDSKEKQLQQAGTLGQQLLAQRMELEERIRMLQDMELDSGEGDDMRDKYRELVDTIRAWDAENEQLSNLLGAKVNGTQSSTVELPRSEIERSVERSKASGSGTTAAQSSRRAKNAAHRADDVEFAFEIGSGLLTEVRRLQSLLAERDKAIQDMKEEKDDLDKTVESLRTALRHQEQSAEKYKEENWNLEVTLQELKTQLTESQVTAQRLESEQKRLTKALTTTREAVDQHKNEAERHNNAYQELKAKHDADVAQARRQAASLQRDKSDLQQTLDTLKAEHAKASKRLPRFPLTPNGTSTPTLNTPTIEEDEFFSTNGASTNRKKLDTSGLFPVDGFDEHDSSPEQSPTRPFFSPSHPNNEIEALQQRLAHAQRQINTLKGSLQREKELRIEYKRKLDAGAATAEDEDDDNVEGIAQEDSNEPKPKVRLTPFRVGKVSRGGRGGGRGRGRGRGGMTLMQRLQAQSPNAEFPDDDDNVHVDAERSPVLSLPPALPRFSSEEPEVASDGEEEATAEKDVQLSPSPTPASKRASVDGMDPVFANILRRPTSGRAAGSPLRNSVLSRVPRPRPLAKRRGGAAFQEARPPSFANEPEALANELGDLDFRTLDDTFELPEPTKETAEFACQTEQEPSAPEEIARSPPLPEPFVPSMPVVSEIGIQVEPEPEPEPIRVEISSQTDAEPVLERAEVAVQHFDLTPSKVLISTASATDPLPEPEPIPVPEPVPIPVVVDAITQTTDNTPSTQDADVQTAAMEPEPVTVTVDAIAQTIDNGPLTQDVDIQTLPAEPPVPLPEPIYIPVTVDAIAQTIDNTRSTQDMNTQTPTVEPAETREVQIQTPGVSVLEVSVQAEHIEEPAAVVTTPRTYVSSFAYASVGSSTEDLTLTVRPMVHTVPLEIEDDDGTETEMASIIETDTDDYVDARQSISLTTPTESMEDYHSIMTVTDNDFSSDSDAESIKASAVSSRNALVSPIPTTQDASTSTTLPEAGVLAEPEPVRTYESKGISAEPEEDRTPEPGPVVESEVSPVPPSKELRDTSMQTDEWIPPAAVAIAVPTPTSIPSSPVAPPSPALFRVGLTPQQFQFISPPPSAGPTTTALPATPSPSIAALRDSTSSFIPRPRTALSDRRQSIESTLSFAREDAIARSRTPSNVVDKTRPPMMVLPPPPRQPPPNSMPPPSFIPEHRQPKSSLTSREIPPPRPTSPPPPELIQRATTPIFGQLNVPGSRLKHHSSSAASSQVGGLRQPPSTASFDARNRREMSMTSLNSARQSADSHRSSMSSDRLAYDQPSQEGPTTPERTPLANRNSNAGTTDPAVIHAITQTMIGEFLYKYTRRAIGKGHGERRHKRFFWVHPYTRTLYWSSADPGSSNVSESSAKSAYIEGVRSVLDPNPMPPGIYQYSIVVATPQREMKFTAPTKERHDIWFSALQYLLTRPNNTHGTSPLRNGTASGLASPLSMDAELSGSDGQRPSAFASPHSQRSVRTAQTGMSGESWNSTPRGQRSHSQLSMRSSMGKRSGTPAAEYLRWSGAEPHSPTKSFENMQEQDDEMDFELHEDTTSDGGFEGLENVRACCDGRHTVGRSGKVIHHHHHHHDQQQNQDTPTQRPPSRLREKHLDVHPSEVARPASPAWSFRSRTGSTASNDGGGFFSRFGTRRSMKTITADRR